MIKNKDNNSSFSTNNLSTDSDKQIKNITNLSLEEVLNIDDIIEKMSNYKNQSIFTNSKTFIIYYLLFIIIIVLII